MVKRKTRSLMITVVVVVLVALAGYFGYQWFTKTGLFYVPGEILFANGVGLEEQELISNATKDIEFKHNITVSVAESLTAQPEGVLYDILIPVTDFYDPRVSVTADEAKTSELISVNELNNSIKLLAIDNVYYLDALTGGAFFQYFQFEGNADDVQKLTEALQAQLPSFPTSETLLTLAQTGVTALSRGMLTKLNQVGDASYFATNIGEYLSNFDLTHTSNESSFSDYADARNICSHPKMINALTSIGLDIVELTGNHNQDCGDDDALSTIQQYRDMGIRIVGGGENATTAAEPLLIEDKGTKITMLGYNLSTGGYTTDNTPGANFYTHEKALADISAAKARGDFVIVDVQYYECNAYDNTTENTTCDYANSSAGDQIGLFRELIDMGADVVVGTAAHQPQTYEKYHDGMIYYGLGNLFFDQVWWPGTTRSLILVHYFFNGKLLQTRIVPTVYGDEMQVRLMDNADAEWFINRLNQARPQEVL